MDDKELSALKALAEAATPGPWIAHEATDSLHAVRTANSRIVADVGYSGSLDRDKDNAAYIAAANPQAILSLISRIESADLLGEHYEMLCQSKDARILELEAALQVYANPANWRLDDNQIARVWYEPDSTSPDTYAGFEHATNVLATQDDAEVASRCRAQGGNTSVDLSGLTRYKLEQGEHRGFMDIAPDGIWLHLYDVQALLATPARDVGGLAEPLAWACLSIQDPELTNDPALAEYWSRKGRVVTPLYATSPAPSVKQEAAYDHLVIALGKGLIEVGQGHEGSERLPAILFGRNGAGAVGIETEGDRIMKPGECIAAITFGNVESLDVVAEKIAELRARIWPDAAPSAIQGEVKVPEGFVLMPKALTAENGAKGTLTGEFKEVIQIACTECDPDGESCAVCDDAGTIDHIVPIGWSNIKAIYARAVELLAAAPAPGVVNGEKK